MTTKKNKFKEVTTSYGNSVLKFCSDFYVCLPFLWYNACIKILFWLLCLSPISLVQCINIHIVGNGTRKMFTVQQYAKGHKKTSYVSNKNNCTTSLN